jgi:cytochrome P450
VTVICELLGVPAEDGARFRVWTDALSAKRGDRRDARAAVGEMLRFLSELIAAKRADPADDLLSAMVAARDGDDRLSEDELISLAFLVLWAGYENSVHVVANAVVSLLAQPAKLEAIRAQPSPHSEAMIRATEELLRHDQPVVNAIRRFPTEDLEIHGTVIPAGDLVLLCLDAADHDPGVFADAARLDLSRDPNPHVAFGLGPHYCLGAPLARLETRIAVWTLAHRLPGLALAAPAGELEAKDDYRQRTYTSLPVRFTAQGG